MGKRIGGRPMGAQRKNQGNTDGGGGFKGEAKKSGKAFGENGKSVGIPLFLAGDGSVCFCGAMVVLVGRGRLAGRRG